MNSHGYNNDDIEHAIWLNSLEPEFRQWLKEQQALTKARRKEKAAVRISKWTYEKGNQSKKKNKVVGKSNKRISIKKSEKMKQVKTICMKH